MKNKKKKIRLKNKKILLLLVIILIIIIIPSYILFVKIREKNIKNTYYKTVLTKKNATIYNDKKKKIGSFSKDIILYLENTKKPNKFFKLKDNPYYVYYKDVKKTKKTSSSSIPSYYIPLSFNATSTKSTVLENNNNKIILNSIDLPIIKKDNDNYYVLFLNDMYKIKKNNNIKEKEANNSTEENANHISILYYDNINESCNDYNCTSTTKLKEELNILKDNNFYTISKDEYISYLNKNLKLKQNAILLLTKNDYLEIAKTITNELGYQIDAVEESGLVLNQTNKTTNTESNLSSLDSYQMKSYSLLDNIIKMANGEEVVENEPNPNQGIAVLNYHFFFDPKLGEECNESICLDVAKFRQHLEYLKNNGYKTLTMEEFKRWMYNEIELPEKSVLITIDDGAMGTGKHNGHKLIPLLEEYDLQATLFLITGWWDIENYRSKNLTIQSHTNDMHQYGTCGRGQFNCYSYEQGKADVQKSIDIIGNNDSFCFPFYMYSDTSLQVIKDLGFKLAFVGGSRKATRKSNKFLIPRYPIHDGITLNQFISMVS